ncbi:response regulator transcription factor [Chitinophagaceae bacterium LB-8]|uniref:Response regulator transcription factor n=1 Tax=Paraflavisolibacter caeni TaxID=2982496 RepID=A0A9X2XVN0_9BACT|nr:response regulator transcription factor [Paraflavisolibacter caeni]MCU7549840.1 response regulator transcription factor [Paraflavisolibacter caeni]
MTVKIGIADDHQLFLKSLSVLVNSFPNCNVTVESLNGKDLQHKLELAKDRPDILLLDVNMPVMNGIEAAKVIADKYPEIKMVALSMKDDDTTIINMIKSGCCAYLLKDIHPEELEKALMEIYNRGYYNADAVNVNYRRLIKKAHEQEALSITEKEKAFLKLACSDLTYKQIAAKLNLAERTIDGYRESLFIKLNVQSRVGMVLEGIRRGIISLDECEV